MAPKNLARARFLAARRRIREESKYFHVHTLDFHEIVFFFAGENTTSGTMTVVDMSIDWRMCRSTHTSLPKMRLICTARQRYCLKLFAARYVSER
jgi:hypothetical protein